MKRLNKEASGWSLAALVVIMLLTSCGPSMRKAMENNIPEAAKNCNDLFPVIEKRDDSAYQDSLRNLETLYKASKEANETMQTELSQLYRENEALKYTVSPNCDSAVLRALEIAKKERARGDRLEEDNRKLVNAARNMAPIETVKKSTAELVDKDNQLNACAENIAALAKVVSAKQEEADKYKAKSESLGKDLAKEKSRGGLLVPWWIIIAIAAYSIASAVRGSLNPLKWIGK